MKQMKKALKRVGVTLAALLTQVLLLTSCIEPPLNLPAQELIVDMPLVVTDLEIVWDVNVDWTTQWHYGWDSEDERLWGDLTYPTPSSFEVRRYYVGDEPRGPRSPQNTDAFTIYSTSFRRTYQFGYYDLLLWSNIDNEEGEQVVLVDDSSLDEVFATTTVTRSMALSRADRERANALYNQPEVFYSAYPRDVYISRNMEDYDYFNEEENVWVKHVNCTLEPLVYIYLVQVILYNNDGRVRGISGDCALSALSSGTSVNTGHTLNDPCMVYFNARMKQGIEVNGRKADIIGGKLTTYGLCDMDGYRVGSRAQYAGSRGDLPNYLYFDLVMSNGTVQTLREEVTAQCQSQSHGGIITIEIDCQDVEIPKDDDDKPGSLFNPKVEDYDELVYDIPM